MAESKQSNLNGAYYGPSVPPQRTYRSVGRSGCGPCCLLCNLIKFIVSIVIILGIIVLVLWLVLRPNPIKVHATSASLTQFDLSNGSTLEYNLTVDMSIRNPNKRIGLYYDSIETQAYYDGSRFGFDTIPPFYQGHKNTSSIEPAFQGTQLLLGDSLSSTYSKEKNDGYYNVELKINAKIRLKIWKFKIHHVKPKVTCKLKLPVPGISGSFSETKCDVDF